MASIVRKQTKTGVRYDIQLSPTEHPERPKIALGRIKKEDALTVKTHIHRLLNHKMGAELSPLTQEWLINIPYFLKKQSPIFSAIFIILLSASGILLPPISAETISFILFLIITCLPLIKVIINALINP